MKSLARNALGLGVVLMLSLLSGVVGAPVICGTQNNPQRQSDCDSGSPSCRPPKNYFCKFMIDKGSKFCACTACDAPPGAQCDPHITGFDGSHYLLKGKADAVYSLLSETAHQINIKLFSPVNFTVPGLWIGDVGILADTTRVAVHLLSGGKPALKVQVNDGKPIMWSGKPSAQAVDQETTVSFMNSNQVKFSAADMTVWVMLKYDPYFKVHHLDAAVAEISPAWADVHGVLGQTYSKAFGDGFASVAATVTDAPATVELKLEGAEDDYIVTGLYGADDKFNRFQNMVSQRRSLLADAPGKVTSLAVASMAVKFDDDSVFELHGNSRRALLEKVKLGSCGK